MKPYYEHAGITIYHGDCREWFTTGWQWVGPVVRIEVGAIKTGLKAHSFLGRLAVVPGKTIEYRLRHIHVSWSKDV